VRHDRWSPAARCDPRWASLGRVATLIDALGSADVVAAEDTRRVRTLAKALDVRITGRVVSLFDQVEAARVPALVGEVEAGATVWWSATPACP